MHIYIYIHVCLWTCVLEARGWCWVSSSNESLIQILQPNLKLMSSAIWARQPVSSREPSISVSTFPSLGLQTSTAIWSSYMGAEEQNASPHDPTHVPDWAFSPTPGLEIVVGNWANGTTAQVRSSEANCRTRTTSEVCSAGPRQEAGRNGHENVSIGQEEASSAWLI